MGVAEPNAMAELAHELLDNVRSQSQLCELPACTLRQCASPATIGHRQSFHVLLEVEIEEFEDEVEFVTIRMDNVEQSNDVGVSHLLEKRDLSDGGGRDTLIFGFEADLLEGNNAIVVGKVSGLVNDAVCSCARRVRLELLGGVLEKEPLGHVPSPIFSSFW